MFDFWTIFLAVVVGILYIWWKNTTRDAVLPPGPPTVPFLGNLLSVNPETVLDTFQEYRRKYGEVFSLITGSKTLVVISGYDTLREIFIKHGDVTSERPDIFITREVGKFKGITVQFYFESDKQSLHAMSVHFSIHQRGIYHKDTNVYMHLHLS